MATAFGVKYEMSGAGAAGAFQLNGTYNEPALKMTLPRMMHESCIVKNAKNQPRLLVIGGKCGFQLATCAYTDSVIGFDMFYAFKDKVNW